MGFVRYLLLILSIQVTSVIAEEVFIVGTQYDIPVDCNETGGSIKPAPIILPLRLYHDQSVRSQVHDHGVRSQLDVGSDRVLWNIVGRFSGSMDVQIDGKIELKNAALNQLSQINAGTGISMEVDAYPNALFRYEIYCVDSGIGIGETIQSLSAENKNAFSMKTLFKKSIKVPARPAGSGINYGFYAQARIHVPVPDYFATKNRSAELVVVCKDGVSTATANHRLDNPSVGTHYLTIPVGGLDFKNCQNENFDLLINFNGGNFQLQGLEALYYEKF